MDNEVTEQGSRAPLWNRRRILGAAGAMAGGAVIAASPWKKPETAQALTTDVLYDKGGAVFNVRAYGATGNGSTDDTASIKAARDAAIAGGGGIVWLPAGNFLVSSVIAVTAYGVTFEGTGQSSTKILVSNSYPAGDVFSFSGLNTNGQSGGVRKLAINSNSARTGGAAINLASVSNIVIEDVDMTGQFNGIVITGTGALQHINRGYYQNFSTGGTGIWVNSSNTNDTYVNEIIMDNGDGQIPLAGLRITQSQAVWATNCDFLHSRNCLLVDTPSGGLITWCFFSGCAWDNGIDRSMFINPAPGSQVNGLTFVDCWSSSAHTYDGCYVGGPVDGCYFIGHRFFANHGNGLYVVAPAKNVHVDSCIASANVAGFGFIFTASASDFAVRNCRSGPYGGLPGQGTGLAIGTGSNNYVVTSNILTGNSTSLSDAGGPAKVVANNLV